MTGLSSPSRHGRSHGDGSDVVTSLGTIPRLARCSVFKDRSAACAEGLSRAGREPPRGRPLQYIARRLAPALSARPRGRTGTVAAAAKRPPATRRRSGGACPPGAPRRRAPRPARRAARRPAPRRRPARRPGSIRRRASLATEAEVLARAAPAGGPPRRRPLGVDHRLRDVSGTSRARAAGRSAASASCGRLGAVEPLHQPPRELALGLTRMARRVERLAEQQPVVLRPSPRRGRSSASRTSPPADR